LTSAVESTVVSGYYLRLGLVTMLGIVLFHRFWQLVDVWDAASLSLAYQGRMGP